LNNNLLSTYPLFCDFVSAKNHGLDLTNPDTVDEVLSYLREYSSLNMPLFLNLVKTTDEISPEEFSLMNKLQKDLSFSNKYMGFMLGTVLNKYFTLKGWDKIMKSFFAVPKDFPQFSYYKIEKSDGSIIYKAESDKTSELDVPAKYFDDIISNLMGIDSTDPDYNLLLLYFFNDRKIEVLKDHYVKWAITAA